MKDLVVHWERLQAEGVECARISDLATDKTKQELFARLAEQLAILVSELERAITANANGG